MDKETAARTMREMPKAQASSCLILLGHHQRGPPAVHQTLFSVTRAGPACTGQIRAASP